VDEKIVGEAYGCKHVSGRHSPGTSIIPSEILKTWGAEVVGKMPK